MIAPRVVVVTGANRGIGRAICNLILSRRELAPLTLYATSRRGDDLGFEAGEGRRLQYPKLDISNSGSIHSFADDIERSGSLVDVLINNAGVNLDHDFSYENAKRTLDVNYRGTLEMSRTLLPFLKPGSGRIVTLSSVASSLRPYSEALGARFRSLRTLEDLSPLIQDYESAVQSNTATSLGWPSERSYSVSKACVNAFTSILAAENPDVAMNCCCPGWIDTEMGGLVGSRGMRPPKTVEDGARIPVRLAFGDLGGVTGRYWANDSVRSKEEGRVQEW